MFAHYLLALLDALHTAVRDVAESPGEFVTEVIRRTITNLANRVVANALVAGGRRLRRSWRSGRGE